MVSRARLGLKYLDGDFEIGEDEDNLEYGNSELLYAEATLSRRRVNDPLTPRTGYVLETGARLASEAVASDTDYRGSLRPDHLADTAGRDVAASSCAEKWAP